MATNCTLGTARNGWTPFKFFTPGTPPTPDDYVARTTVTIANMKQPHEYTGFLTSLPTEYPQSSTNDGVFMAVLPGEVANSFGLTFVGTKSGTQPVSATKKIRARVWAVEAVGDGWFGFYLGELEIVLGSRYYQSATPANPFSETGKYYYFPESISIVADRTETPPAMRVVGQESGCHARISFDGMGAARLIVSLSVDDAESAGAAWKEY